MQTRAVIFLQQGQVLLQIEFNFPLSAFSEF